MKRIAFLVFTFLFLIGLAHNANAQKKVIRNQNAEKSLPTSAAPKEQESPISNNHNSIETVRQLLIKEYENKPKKKQKDTGLAPQKQILSVNWIGADFNKIENVTLGEMISLAVLTKGYNIGDTVRITIDSEDEQSLMAGIQCNEITFVGRVNYEHLAFLKDIFFTIEGDDEKIVIAPNWLDRYYCK